VESKRYDFLKAVLGQDGAAALKKAADRLGGLENVILPRAIMAWLSVAARNDYEGEVPGIDDSYLDFSKNHDGSFSGSIAFGDEVLPFQNANSFQLAASVAVCLGANDLEGGFDGIDLVKLGKSIDIMAKAKYVSNLEELYKALPGPPQAPQVRGIPEAATPPSGPQRDKGPKQKKAPAVATQAKVTRPKIPSLKPKAPKPKIAVPEAAKHECDECGMPLIKNDTFVGCMCFKDVARYVSLTKHQGKTYISFNDALDEDAIATILETLGVSHG
jgi:hypothetical protein